MSKKETLDVRGNEVSIIKDDLGDYICLTDMVKGQETPPGEYIRRWLRSGPTIEFLGVWEKVHNKGQFNLVLWNQIKSQSTNNAFVLSVKRWLETGAIGLRATAGRYGGTYAHFDIAIHFANWFSAEFYVYLIKDYQRLRIQEALRLADPQKAAREFVKIYFRIQTDSVERFLVSPQLRSGKKSSIAYASEADLINKALFGMTAQEWRQINPQKKGNQRDYASFLQLIILSALEVIDAKLLQWGCDQEQRLQILIETVAEYTSMIPDSKAYRELLQLSDEQKKLEGR